MQSGLSAYSSDALSGGTALIYSNSAVKGIYSAVRINELFMHPSMVGPAAGFELALLSR